MARALGLLPLEDFPAVAVQDAQRDRLGRERETCGGDDCVRHSPCTSTSPKINSPCSGAAPTNWIRNGCGFAERMRCSSSSGAA